MTIHVDVIKEESYTIEIDVAEDKEDELYEELTCQPCIKNRLPCGNKKLSYGSGM